ncbi:hypothetical protein RB195_001239 [Necator americanus]|uniref:Uncharacterized protein n=1 Tax=Necator americanus TaxID=51031 RepID=A0ABR1DDS9_NECAM
MRTLILLLVLLCLVSVATAATRYCEEPLFKGPCDKKLKRYGFDKEKGKSAINSAKLKRLPIKRDERMGRFPLPFVLYLNTQGENSNNGIGIHRRCGKESSKQSLSQTNSTTHMKCHSTKCGLKL